VPNPKAKRHWIVDAVDEETGEVDRGAVMEALADAEAVAYRMGHAIQVTPLREVIVFADESERAVTRAVRFDVYGVPARKVNAADLGVSGPAADTGGPLEDGPLIDAAEVLEAEGLAAEPDIPVEPEPSVGE
jgi:hypothetical protein